MASCLHDLTAAPFMMIVQAPHWLVSQPTWVPVSPNPSRRKADRSVRPSTSPETALPFTVIETLVMLLPPWVFLGLRRFSQAVV